VPYFVVVSEQGPAWAKPRSMREQAGWKEHAEFVNALARRGFILLAGPLGDGAPHRAMLLVSGESEPAVRRRLLEDPWMSAGILRLRSIDPWTVLASNDLFDPVLAEIEAHSS
jgi:uncharacterized protein YciI